MGVFAPLVGVIGTMQALEAIKLVAGIGETLAGRLHAVRRARQPLARGAALARSRIARSAASRAPRLPRR